MRANLNIRTSLLERFLKYVKITSTSDSERADAGMMPSTNCQWDMARCIFEELTNLGLQNVTTTPDCYTYGILPATENFLGTPSICLLAHIDTVDEVSGQNVKPQVMEKGYDKIIKSDGTTLLGADDKAGIAEIITMLEYFKNNPEIEHKAIEVMFSPDEETGHGMDKVPMNLIKSKCAYTVDGGSLGELETECFNAVKSEIIFEGIACHTGTARNMMVNANFMASSFIQNLPHMQLPETTDGYDGFYAVMNMEGSIEKSKITVFLRDFTQNGMENKKHTVERIAETVALTFGGKASVNHIEQYKNMKDNLNKAPYVTENLVKAYKQAGVEPTFTPIRGGTDGSRLTEIGLPTPNIFTGGHNFHSKDEWASLDEMEKACEILINLSTITSSC